MENPNELEEIKDETSFTKLKKAATGAIVDLRKGVGDTGTSDGFKKDPKGTVGFWLMTALSAILGILVMILISAKTEANRRADAAEKLVVIERAKRDADKENSDKRVEYWVEKAIEVIKESAKKEVINDLNK